MYFQQIFLIISEVHKGPCCVFVGIGDRICYNTLVTNGLSNSYYLDGSIFIFRGSRSIFAFLFHFSMKIMSANRIAPDGTPRFASHLGLFCLPMSH